MSILDRLTGAVRAALPAPAPEAGAVPAGGRLPMGAAQEPRAGLPMVQNAVSIDQALERWDMENRLPTQQRVNRSVMTTYTVGQAVWTPRRYDNFADEAYVRNAVAFRCIKMIADNVAGVGLKLRRKKVDFEEHQILDLLARPQPLLPGKALMSSAIAYLMIAGNSYLEGVGPSTERDARPTELWPHRPDFMKVIAGPRGVPGGYFRDAAGGAPSKRWEVDQMTGMSSILQIKDFNPLNEWYGMARVDPAAYGIDRHNAASAHNKALLDNGARPSGALIYKPAIVGGQTVFPPTEVIEQGEKRVAERHTGADRAGQPLVLSGDVDWKEMSISPKDMDFNEGKLDAARDICYAFGVPHILLVPGASTFNNVKEARLDLYEDTIIPLVELVVGMLNVWLCPRWDPTLELYPDLDSVPALEPRRETKRKGVLELFDGGLVRRDEARQMLGQQPVGGEKGQEFGEPKPAAKPGEKPAPKAD